MGFIGAGPTGKLVRRMADEKGHKARIVINSDDCGLSGEELAAKLKNVDVVVDFSSAAAVPRNVEAAIAAGVPLVEGTTGWNGQREEIERIVADGNGSMVFGANFSIGVNLFYRVAEFTAELFAKFPEYQAFIEEQHHSRKKDAPSGTALNIKDVVSKHVDIGDIAATRAGNIPGTHRVGFDGPADQVLLEHTARSREGFAIGALMAAEWIIGKKGFYEFGDVMDEVVGK